MGISYKAALDFPLLDPDQEREAIRLWQQHSDRPSLDLLLRSHARLVYAHAMRWSRDPVVVEDLVAEGMIGLMKAVERFDLSVGSRFATYARWWVGTTISTSFASLRSVIDVPARTLNDLRAGRLSGAERDMVLSVAMGIVPLDGSTEDDEGRSVLDRLTSPDPTPEEAVLARSSRRRLQQMVEIAVSQLAEPDRQILMRHTLGGDEALEDIASDLGITRARAQQYEGRGIARLKRSLIEQGFSPLMLNE